MKKIISLAICILALTSCGNEYHKNYSHSDYNTGGDYVYICTGGKSKRYHPDEYCNGLRRCSGSVEEVSVDEAEDMGRTPCKICY